VDYLAVVGNIIYNAAQSSVECTSGIDIFEPVNSDTMPGTHIYVAGNFSWSNVDPNPCSGTAPTDGEGIIIDTLDSPSTFSGQVVVDNNILIANGGRGGQVNSSPMAHVYFRHNTAWGNNWDTSEITSGWCGELFIDNASNTEESANLTATNAAAGCGDYPIYAYFVGGGDSSDHIQQNWGYSASGTNTGIASSLGFSYDPSNAFGINPSFANPVAPGAPSCGSTSSVPNCMATVIANFTPRTKAAVGYGYQVPSGKEVYDPLFPQWLCNVNLPVGLVTMGCLTEP
jgi:hypothetical protein